jgi:hypothetical protein
MKSVPLETHRVPRSGTFRTLEEVAKDDPFSDQVQKQSDFARQLAQDMMPPPIKPGKEPVGLAIEVQLLRRVVERLHRKVKFQRLQIRTLLLEEAMAVKPDRKTLAETKKWMKMIQSCK